MAGQIIKLAGVTAAATVGTPRIIMGAADVAALRVPSLAHAVSAQSLQASAAGISGRCRLTGKILSSRGTASLMRLKTAAGFSGIGVATNTSQAALSLPPDSASSSYCIVLAVFLSDLDTASSTNVVTAFTASDVLVANVLRHYGATNSVVAVQGGMYSGGGGTLIASPPAGTAKIPMAAGAWAVVAIDFDASTLATSISTNGGAFNVGTSAVNFAPGAGGYFEIGQHNTGSGLRNTLVGHAYLFNDSLRKTPLGQNQLAAVIAGLKDDYGIA